MTATSRNRPTPRPTAAMSTVPFMTALTWPARTERSGSATVMRTPITKQTPSRTPSFLDLVRPSPMCCPIGVIAVHDGAYLAGQDRKVRLRHRNEDAHHEADTEKDAQLLGFGEAFADVLPHRGHRHVGAQVEEADTGHQEDGRAGEYEQFVPGNVHPRGYRKQKYQQADRYDRNQGFPEFLPQGFPKVPKNG